MELVKSFLWGDAIVVLSLLVDGSHYDVPGIYYGETAFGRYKGRYRVKAMGVDNLYIEPERIVDAAEYFKIWNEDGLKPLPKGAAGRLFFQEAVESPGVRGHLLAQMISTEGDNEKANDTSDK